MIGAVAKGAVASVVASTLLVAPPSEPEGPPAPPPGGYWGVGEKREPEPLDGKESLTVGAILFPLGMLRAGAGAINVVTTNGNRCAEIYGFDDDSCQSFRIYGWWGIGFGSLMAVTGAVFLGIGLQRKNEHDAWRRRYGVSLAPTFSPQGSGASLTVRF